MQFNVDTSLVEAARKIAPIIQGHKEEAERNRRLSRCQIKSPAPFLETGANFTPKFW